MGDPGSIPGLGRCPGEGNDYPLQYSALENSMDRGLKAVADGPGWASDAYCIRKRLDEIFRKL